MKLTRASSYLADEFGGKSAFLKHAQHKLAHALGMYRSVKEDDIATSQRIIFLCQGNICRSPYAELRARSEGINCLSAGFDTDPGKPANPSAIRAALKRGIDLSEHRTKHVSEIMFGKNDLVLVMEPRHIKELQRAGIQSTKAGLIGVWSTEARPYLQDPYGRSEEYFDKCYAYIDSAIENLTTILRPCPAKI